VSTLADVVEQVAAGVAAAHDELNRLDAAAGDGDLGNTVMLAAQAVRASINADRDASPAALLRRCGTDVATSAPSTSGTLTARALLAAGRAVDSADQTAAPVTVVAIAFQAALAGIQSAGKAAPGDRTMLDALAPAVAELMNQAEAGACVPRALAAAAAAARQGAEATRDMTPRAGRARWLAERSKGTEDAGAHLIAEVLGLAADALA
jgi:dihydroxyacetone kinase